MHLETERGGAMKEEQEKCRRRHGECVRFFFAPLLFFLCSFWRLRPVVLHSNVPPENRRLQAKESNGRGGVRRDTDASGATASRALGDDCVGE